MGLDRFVDKDILDQVTHSLLPNEAGITLQLSRDIKELIKAIRSLKVELGEE